MAMYEYEIGGKIYPVSFGMRFLREADKTYLLEVPDLPGYKQPRGFSLLVSRLLSDDPTALEEIILLANKTENPRLNQGILDDWLDNEADFEAEKERVVDFFEKSSVLKPTLHQVKQEINSALGKTEA